MIDVISKNLNIQLSSKENINAYLSGGNLQVIFGKNAEMDIVRAVTYIKSGEAEIAAETAQRMNEFNLNVTEKTITFNNNAIQKTQDFDDNATTAISEAEYWAEQAQTSALSMANKDLSNLSNAGEAKFIAKQDVISDLTAIRSGASSIRRRQLP